MFKLLLHLLITFIGGLVFSFAISFPLKGFLLVNQLLAPQSGDDGGLSIIITPIIVLGIWILFSFPLVIYQFVYDRQKNSLKQP
jgi:pilus assembly protein TadC